MLYTIVPREVKCVSRCSISNYCEENSKNNTYYLYCIPEITYNCGLLAPKTIHAQKYFMPKASNTKANHFPFSGLLTPVAAAKLTPCVL